MEREDSIPILQVMEGLYRMPVMKVKEVKPVRLIEFVKLVHHHLAHIVAIFDNILSFRLAVVITDPVDDLIGDFSPGEKMHLMILFYQCFRQIRCSICKPADAFGIEGFPAEKRYFK